jgi:hypothetical protein
VISVCAATEEAHKTPIENIAFLKNIFRLV